MYFYYYNIFILLFLRVVYPFFDKNLYINYQLTTTMKMGMDEKKQGNDKCLAINIRSRYLEA